MCPTFHIAAAVLTACLNGHTMPHKAFVTNQATHVPAKSIEGLMGLPSGLSVRKRGKGVMMTYKTKF